MHGGPRDEAATPLDLWHKPPVWMRAAARVVDVGAAAYRRFGPPVEAAARLDGEEVFVPAQAGPDVHGWWLDGDAGCVVVVHGFGGQASDLGRAVHTLNDAGMAVFALEVLPLRSGPRRGGGPLAQFDAVSAGVDYAWGRCGGRQRLALLGHSLGGSAAVTVAARRRDVAAVVTLGAVADPTTTRIGGFPAFVSRRMIDAMAHQTGVDPRPTFAASAARDLSAPLLVVHGRQDRTIPLTHGDLLAGAGRDARLLVVDGAHAPGPVFDAAVGEILPFLHDALRQAA